MQELSSPDIRCLVGEMSVLSGAKIQKVYQEERDIHLDLHITGLGTKTLVAGPGKLFLTSCRLTHSTTPTGFSMFLRKKLKGLRIESVRQLGFERIIALEAGELTLVFELFGTGNAVLTDKSGKILGVMEAQEWKDRVLRPGREYAGPPAVMDLLFMKPEQFAREIRKSEKKAVAFLSRDASLGSAYAEEACFRAGADKNAKCSGLTAALAGKLASEALKLVTEKKSPRVFPENGFPAMASPIMLETMKDRAQEQKESFNEACEEVFIRGMALGRGEKAEKAVDKASEKILLRLKEQEEALEKLTSSAAAAAFTAEKIYEKYQRIEELKRKIEDLSGKGWESAKKELSCEEDVSEVDLKDKSFTIIVGSAESGSEEKNGEDGKGANGDESGESKKRRKELKAKIFFEKSVGENAENYYSKAKKAKKKIEGLKKAIIETRKAIEEKEAENKEMKDEAEAKSPFPEKRSEKKLWHEKFRWFVSSQGFLCVSGQDATRNEIVVKKHAEQGQGDIILHAEIPGSPFTVIKAESREVGKETISEAAEFTASYSRAWKMGVGVADVYWASPEQVSQKTPSGDYMGKGSFMVYGKKNWVRSELGIGFAFDNGSGSLVSGPLSSVRGRFRKLVAVKPGREDAKSLAVKVRAQLFSVSSKEEQERIRRIPLDEIASRIPSGSGEMVRG